MTNPIVLRRNFRVGNPDAENDHQYLLDCFIDNGEISILLDPEEPRCILLGRTGSGKSAILQKILNDKENCKEISPDELCLNYISNSNIIYFFEEVGANLALFYKLLWEHLIIVELIREKIKIENSSERAKLFEFLKSKNSRSIKRRKAIEYVEEWGDKFWEDTEYRVKEITEKIESDLSASVDVDIEFITLGAKGAEKLTKGQKVEIIQRAKKVVNHEQISKLKEIIEILSEDVFNDKKNPLFFLMDRLDDQWVDDKVKFHLIRSLIDSLITFRKIENFKLILAIRTDLIEKVLHEASQMGLQREKYDSYIIEIKWGRQAIRNLLDTRVNQLFRLQYTKDSVSLGNILPSQKIQNRTPDDYIIDRTFFRPREAILFLNECISKADLETRISIGNIRAAESSYSIKRLSSLADEWKSIYPAIDLYWSILESRGVPFSIRMITQLDWDNFAEKVLSHDEASTDPIADICKNIFLDGKGTIENLFRPLFSILYHIGIIGLRTHKKRSNIWSYIDSASVPGSEINLDTRVDIHLTFWLALGTYRRDRRSND